LASQTFAIFWFDTEDFVNPETDDAPLRIAKIMERHGVKVVFKIVGEKLRALKKNKRNDVINAISHHDVGYHSDLHSIHPTPTEYVGNLDWDEGVREFEKRERPGYVEIKKTFGKRPSCYGHPGLSWVPQAYPVLKKWGIHVYLDETFTISTIGERPFWYGNMLNIMCLRSNVSTVDAGVSAFPIDDDWLSKKFPDEFAKLYQKLQSEENGVISIYCHPTTYVTAEWWEKNNFLYGRNPESMVFKKAPLKSKTRIEEDYKQLESFVIGAKKKFPHLRFITARDALKIYKDKASGRKFTREEIKGLCEKGVESINYQKVAEGVWVSPAESFVMIIEMLSKYRASGEKGMKMPKFVRLNQHPFGPKASFETVMSNGVLTPVKDFLHSCKIEFQKIRKSGYLPSLVKIGQREKNSKQLSAVDMFATACSAFLKLFDDGDNGLDLKDNIQVVRGVFEIGKNVTLEGAKTDWKYHLNPQGFEAPKQVELARLQTWTLKPATPNL
jgi:hypothetical protein